MTSHRLVAAFKVNGRLDQRPGVSVGSNHF
jgi:hypothetical protein